MSLITINLDEIAEVVDEALSRHNALIYRRIKQIEDEIQTIVRQPIVEHKAITFDSDSLKKDLTDFIIDRFKEIPVPTNGVNGNNGQDGNDGRDGVGMASAIIDRNGELVVTFTDGSIQSLGVVVGRDGIDGKDGRDGVDGKDGIDGILGKDGIDGRNGLDGTNGRDGVDGSPGRDGIDGKDGAPGRDGVDGALGIDGKDGSPGIDGLPGKDGIDGLPGKDGHDGIDGKDGAPGVNGRDGVDGKDGLNGEDGVYGLPGVDGKDGTPGINGTNGLPGRDGVDGKDGSPGIDGKDGRDGINGKDGSPGADGRDGINGESIQVEDVQFLVRKEVEEEIKHIKTAIGGIRVLSEDDVLAIIKRVQPQQMYINVPSSSTEDVEEIPENVAQRVAKAISLVAEAPNIPIRVDDKQPVIVNVTQSHPLPSRTESKRVTTTRDKDGNLVANIISDSGTRRVVAKKDDQGNITADITNE